ncbi:hypothetical protein [Alkaliphilus peptidifermentans]|uniref:Uncharacterized protein n=1 Tax=Alkaliphilus peptidifermentans DSM 18978 TaxID=1120976 RepID=A0A1G5GCB9_9FIRM|nr:hypothetical protein [Alkaliphilus peptidifermentans]SCY48388.1 hypothetical protein SAMN03080606_01616 [Alkaliphilus peptidifermentans DSM 18978]
MKTKLKSIFLIIMISVMWLPLSSDAIIYNNGDEKENNFYSCKEKNHPSYDEALMNEMIIQQEVLEKEINEKLNGISDKKFEVFKTQNIDELIHLLDHLKAESIAITEVSKKQDELNKKIEALNRKFNENRSSESTNIIEETCVYGKTFEILSIEDLIKSNRIEQVEIKQMINQSIFTNSEVEILTGEEARDTLKEHEERLLIKAREMERLIREIKETGNYKID